MKQLLEAPSILKIFYDVRADNDALFHLHGIQVQASYDVQVLWHLKLGSICDSRRSVRKAEVNRFYHAMIVFNVQCDSAGPEGHVESQPDKYYSISQHFNTYS